VEQTFSCLRPASLPALAPSTRRPASNPILCSEGWIGLSIPVAPRSLRPQHLHPQPFHFPLINSAHNTARNVFISNDLKGSDSDRL